MPESSSSPLEPDLREPRLPGTARRAPTDLRTGWTTGTCAAAAAKAAAAYLDAPGTTRPPARVDVGLPRGGRAALDVASYERGADWAEAVVVKDAGDDPDVTHGARLTVRVTPAAEAGVHLEGGTGVGVVTKPGLGLTVGAAAINPAPRVQITDAIREAWPSDGPGIHAVIGVPGGEDMARRTTNRRLGIVGGISILGTTGIVRPFSTSAWRASVGQAVDVIAAAGGDTLVLTTGGRTERAALRLYPELDEAAFVEVGDFTGYALRRAVAQGLDRVVFVGMAGKLAKLAAGVLMTHWTRSQVDLGMLACLTAEAGGTPDLADAVARANTARHAYELWQSAGCSDVYQRLCRRVARNLARFVEGRLAVEVVMVDFETLAPVGRGAA